jgi:hypothetical protein
VDRRLRAQAIPPAAAVGLAGLGVAVMAVMAATPGSPYQPVLTPEGAPAGPLRALAGAIGLDALLGTPLVIASTVIAALATAAFLVLLREAFRGRVPTAWIVGLVIAAHVLILFVPLLFSRDVYSYAYYGRIAAGGGNPYSETPLDHSDDPLWDYVGPKWVDTPSVYGPAWTALSSAVARTTSDPQGQVDSYRVLAVAASLATCGAIAWVVRSRRPDRLAFALAAFGANPVVLFHSVASGHNDLLVALTIVVALGLALRDRVAWAVAVLAVGAAIKATAVLPLVLLVVWAVWRRPRGARARTGAVLIGTVLVVAVAFAAPYFTWRDPSLGMARLATHEGWLAPSMAFSRVIEWATLDVLAIIPRAIFAALLVLALVRLGRAVARRGAALGPDGVAASWGWALLLFTLLGPVLLPWYVTWSLPLVWVLPRAARTLLLATASLLAVTLWSAEPLRFPLAFGVDTFLGRWIVTPIVLVLLVGAWRDLGDRLRVGSPLEDDEVRSPRAAVGPPPEPRQEVTAGAGQG